MARRARSVLSRWLTPLWPATVVGIAVGATLGGMALQSSTVAPSVSALIRIDQPVDPNQILTTNAPSVESQQSYISGEIAFLSSPGFAGSLRTALNQADDPNLTATQDSQSSVITLSATAPTAAQATGVIDTALRLYSDHVVEQNRQREQAAIDALNGVINGLRDQIRIAVEAPNAPPQYDEFGNLIPPPPVPDTTGFQDRINELQAQKLSLDVQMLRPPGVQVVQPPTQLPVSGVPHWWLGAVGGGLLGGLLALTLAIVWRQRSGVITSMGALEDEVAGVLWPVVRLRSHGERAKVTNSEAENARAVYAQLPAARGACILVVGASAQSGTDGMARLLSFAAAEHGPVDTIRQRHANEVIERRILPRHRNSTTVIIDGGSLTNSSALPRAAGLATHIIIVAMIGFDTYRQARMVIKLARAHGVPVFAVGARRRWWAPGGRTRKAKAEPIAETPSGGLHRAPEVVNDTSDHLDQAADQPVEDEHTVSHDNTGGVSENEHGAENADGQTERLHLESA